MRVAEKLDWKGLKIQSGHTSCEKVTCVKYELEGSIINPVILEMLDQVFEI
jgi:hypothetical protein